ncbi:MAG: LOG family protein [Xenococcaceae cyanobacterium]
MALSSPQNNLESLLKADVIALIDRLPDLKHGKLIKRALEVLIRISEQEVDRLDWKILTASLEDLEQGFKNLYPYRHIRKISIFGSARLPTSSPEYLMAVDFARYITQLGFMVITGAGGGIMQAGNEGAGKENSLGLNIQLPFEQESNPFISEDKLIEFKYFFTRKLFFLRESDAIALFPGGFGTQDEAFETLTLCQTGKYGPAPLVLIDKPGGDYWLSWNEHIKEHLVKGGLVCPEDTSIYTITDDLSVACNAIRSFYCVYHSSRYVGKLFVMRLNSELNDEQIELLNKEFSDILVEGKIEKSRALPEERGDNTAALPRIIFHFNRQSLGRLYQMIDRINHLGISCPATEHPERK